MRRLLIAVLLAACGSSSNGMATGDAPLYGGGDGPRGTDGSVPIDAPGTVKRTVFVIPMENQPSSAIYNSTNAPYINSLISGTTPKAAWATKFQDELPALPSEPHYVWMEAGTNQFNDITFTSDSDPSGTHSTSSAQHLVTQLETAHVTWMSYQQGITSGTCPISTSGVYAPKHDPMLFFQDVVGTTPSKTNAHCAAHHKPYTSFAADLAANSVAQYVFITPDLCHDMHGDSSCAQGTSTSANIQAGDTWLSNELPPIIAYANAHDSIVLVVWDEGDNTNLVPFLALGPRIKPGAVGTTYSHSSQVKSIEEILGVPVLSTVSSANDFADLFQPGMFP